MADEIAIEVSYALPGAQRVLPLRVPADSTARRAVLLSCIDALFPEIDTATCPIGVFGTPVADEYRLEDGDRLEIYRPLENDPMEARRQGTSRRVRA
ncbi:MAG: RnfH family protein [Gammaproteobacteria bacterium]|nr:RnfH family protein [Gammaproteobacteria bacterium]